MTNGARVWLAALFGLGACATTATRAIPLTVRALSPASASRVTDEGVGLIAEPVSLENWDAHPRLSKHAFWYEAESGMTSSAGVGAASMMVDDTFPLLPLPAFRLEIQNHTDHPLSLENMAITLIGKSGRRFSPMLDPEAVVAWVKARAIERHHALELPKNRESLELLMSSARAVPLVRRDVQIAPGSAWEGYVAIRLEAMSLDEHTQLASDLKAVELEVGGLKTGGEVVAAQKFAFSAPARSGIVCPDGKRVSVARHCSKEVVAFDYAAKGPCIQETRIRDKLWATQRWMGGTPVANSDVWRTLLATPASHRAMKRSLSMRWPSYVLLAVSLVGAAAVSAGLAITYQDARGAAGLGMLGLLPIAGGLAYGAERASDEAIDAYNTMAEDSGRCTPIF